MDEQLTDLEILTRDNNAFCLEYYRQVSSATGNLLLSPINISAVMAMVYNGARGETERQMAQVLHISLPVTRLNLAYTQLLEPLKKIQGQRENTLRIANAIFPQQHTPLLSGFQHTVRETYNSHVAVLDYIRPEVARQAINAWIEAQTSGKIKELIPLGRLNTFVRMILAIVVYFKAEWEFQFDPQKTRGMLFHLSLSQRYDVPMMFLTARLPYYETDDFQLVELAFAGCDLSMVLLVPRRSDGLTDLETQLSPERLLNWQKAAQPCLVSLDLPRFDQTSSLQLCPSLRKMGMIDAFDDRLADFSGIDNFKWLFISGCWHKTFLSVDEKGCESSPASQDTPMASSGAEAPVAVSAEAPVAVRADHPFLFFIRENNSGSLLFLGRLVEP